MVSVKAKKGERMEIVDLVKNRASKDKVKLLLVKLSSDFDRMTKVQAEQMEMLGIPVEHEIVQEFTDAVKAEAMAFGEKLYSEHLTDEDIDVLLAIYSSPAYIKMQTVSRNMTHQWLQDKAEHFQVLMEAIVAKHMKE